MTPIGEILIEQGSITQEQLKDALKQQKGHGKKRLGEVLIEMGVITEADVVVALSTQFNFPYLPLKNVLANPDARALVPVELARQYLMVPFDHTNGVLTVVMADPSDEKTIAELEKHTHCKLRIFIAMQSEVEQAIRNCYEKE